MSNATGGAAETADGMVVGVVGAGAMGSGIAQVALARGHRVLLTDAVYATVRRAQEAIAAGLAREVEKGRMTAEARDAALARLQLV